MYDVVNTSAALAESTSACTTVGTVVISAMDATALHASPELRTVVEDSKVIVAEVVWKTAVEEWRATVADAWRIAAEEWARLQIVRSTEAVLRQIAPLTEVALCPTVQSTEVVQCQTAPLTEEAPCLTVQSTEVAVHHPLATLAAAAVQAPHAHSAVAVPLLPVHSAAAAIALLHPVHSEAAAVHAAARLAVAVHAVAARSEEVLVAAVPTVAVVHTEAVADTSVDADKT